MLYWMFRQCPKKTLTNHPFLAIILIMEANHPQINQINPPNQNPTWTGAYLSSLISGLPTGSKLGFK